MNVKNIFKLITLIQDKNTEYEKFIKFVFGENPPLDHNFLARVNLSIIAEERSSPYNKATTHQNEIPRFSVVIPTYNGASSEIRRTINSLLSQKEVLPQEYEIIIVDDGSFDNTKQVVEKQLKEPVKTNLTYIRLKKNFGPTVARNIGVIKARGTYTCFTDDDCVVPNDWISNFQKTFAEHPEAAGVGGWLTSPNKKNNLLHKYYTGSYFISPAERNKKDDTSLPVNNCGVTSNICYKKSVLEKTGGFNHYFPFAGFEDTELAIRVRKNNFTIVCHPDLIQHLTPMSFKYFFRRTPRRGWSQLLIRLIYPEYRSHRFSDKDGMYVNIMWKMQNIRFLENKNAPLTFMNSFLLKAVIVLEEVLHGFGKYWIAVQLFQKRARYHS